MNYHSDFDKLQAEFLIKIKRTKLWHYSVQEGFYSIPELTTTFIAFPGLEAQQLNEKFNDEGLSFHTNNGGVPIFKRCIEPNPESLTELPAGCYQYSRAAMETPEHLIPMQLRKETVIRISNVVEKVSKDIEAFLSNEDLYKSTGVIYKRGFLFYGPPGNSKSTTIRELVNSVFPKDAIIIFLKHMPELHFLQHMSHTLGDRLKVFILEEMTEIVRSSESMGDLDELLNFLDGELSPSRAIFIGCTNYPEDLPGNIVRHSRFDSKYLFNNPTDSERKTLLTHWLGTEPSEKIFKATKDYSIAYLKELFIYHKLHGITLERALADLKDQEKLILENFAKGRNIGFGEE